VLFRNKLKWRLHQAIIEIEPSVILEVSENGKRRKVDCVKRDTNVVLFIRFN
jgi:hypothetical protein